MVQNGSNVAGWLLSTKQVAQRLGITLHRLEYMIDSGQIADAQLRVSGRRIFSEDEVETIERIIKESKHEAK